jgi:hypothetical protein
MENNLLPFIRDDVFDLSILMEKEVFEAKYLERYEVLESNIEAAELIKRAAVNEKSNDNVQLWNIFGYLNILSYDLVSVSYNLVFEQKSWQKVFYARQVVLIIYEGLQDIPEILGKYYKEIFKDITVGQEYIDEMNIYKQEFESFRKKNTQYLCDIRMGVTAHRDQDIDKQLLVLRKIDPYHIKDLMFEFETILRKICDHMQKLLVHTVTLKG